MTQSQINKRDTGFAQISNKLLNDKNLSLKAKGLYAYMFSKPNGWQFSAGRIAIDNQDKRKSVLSGLKELVDKGYIQKNKLKTGRMEYLLLIRSDLSTQKPKSHFGTVPTPHCAKTAPISNTDLISKKDIYSNKEENQNINVPTSQENTTNPQLEHPFSGKETIRITRGLEQYNIPKPEINQSTLEKLRKMKQDMMRRMTIN